MSGYVWGPQPGPQTAAYYADWCPEVLFGGAKYGGKTDFLLGDYLSDVEEYHKHWQGILIRQSLPEFEEIVRRSHELYPKAGGEYAIQAKTWRFANGATLKLRYLERAQDFYKYNGHSYCVAIGTPILMADGSSKPIEDVRIGEYVATLEGPKVVKHVVSPYLAPCCEIVGDGVYQVQPIWHRVLCASGWQSYTSLLGIDSKAFEEIALESCKPQSANALLRCAIHNQDLQSEPGGIATVFDDFCKYSKLSYESSSIIDLLSLRIYWDRQHTLLADLQRKDCYHGVDACGAFLDAEIGQRKGSDSRFDCQIYHGLNGESFQTATGSGHYVLPRLIDVGERIHEHCSADAQDNIRGYTHRPLCGYRHPYDGTERSTVLGSELKACSISLCGKRLVADLSVDGANHYIHADNGIVNVNTWIGFDELGHWADPAGFLMMVNGCLRWAEADIPTKRIRCSANPGGPGQTWISERYQIDRFPFGYRPIRDAQTKQQRMFIPSRVTDNALGLLRDPSYIDRLKGVGSPELVKAWLEGRWDQRFGAYFKLPLFICRPFEIPDHWLRFRAFDYGSKRPFSVGWYAVSPGELLTVETATGPTEVFLPPNCLIRYREWYGMKPGEYNEGIELTFDELADGILSRSGKEKYAYSVADPAIWKHESGPSIYEELYNRGVNFSRADNARVPGWRQVYQRMVGLDGNPMLVVFDVCTELIRTLPLMQHDQHNAEDVDTNGEDHAVDELRYASMSRPFILNEQPKVNNDPLLGKNLLEATFKAAKKRDNRI